VYSFIAAYRQVDHVGRTGRRGMSCCRSGRHPCSQMSASGRDAQCEDARSSPGFRSRTADTHLAAALTNAMRAKLAIHLPQSRAAPFEYVAQSPSTVRTLHPLLSVTRAGLLRTIIHPPTRTRFSVCEPARWTRGADFGRLS
jgi:hypothetical protein